jgi:hypothetical protein
LAKIIDTTIRSKNYANDSSVLAWNYYEIRKLLWKKHHPLQRKKIDQDFNGYPTGPAKDETINPQTEEEKKVADIKNKDGEKRFNSKKGTDEQESDGSANAFDDK